MINILMRNVFRLCTFNQNKSSLQSIVQKIQGNLDKGSSITDAVRKQILDIKTLQHQEQQPLLLKLIQDIQYQQIQEFSDLIHKNIEIQKLPTTFVSINNKSILYMNQDINKLNELVQQSREAINLYNDNIAKAEAIATLEGTIADKKSVWFPENQNEAIQHYINSFQTIIQVYSEFLSSQSSSSEDYEENALFYIRMVYMNSIKMFHIYFYNLKDNTNVQQIINAMQRIQQSSPRQVLHKSSAYFYYQTMIFPFLMHIKKLSIQNLIQYTEDIQQNIQTFFKSNLMDDFQTVKQISMSYLSNSLNKSTVKNLPSNQKILKAKESLKIAVSFINDQDLRKYVEQDVNQTFLKALQLVSTNQQK